MEELFRMAEKQAAYTLELYSRAATSEKGDYKNVAMSPLNIAIALAITAAGARGDTLQQMVSHLKHTDSQTMHQFFLYINSTVLKDGSIIGGPVLDVANCLLVDKTLPVDAAYRQAVKDNYGAEAESVDFKTGAESIRLQVNDWVQQKTRGKIADLFPPNSVNSGTILLVASALYFKGDWVHQFNPERSRDAAFYLLSGMSVVVPMMTTTTKQLIRNCGTFKILKLPYRRGGAFNNQNDFSMYILLPNDTNGLPELEKQLDATAASWLMQHLPTINESVAVGNFLLPRFKISYSLDVSDLLKDLGLTWPFAPNADFSGVLGDVASRYDPICISKVVHKAAVEVNEEGTVAAAATGTSMAFGSAAPTHFEDFVADHPFLFLIREDITGVVVFIGRVANPVE